MRAARYSNGSWVVADDAPGVEPSPGEALIDVSCVGLAREDTQPASTFGGTLGHRFVGTVKAINIPDDPPPSLRDKSTLVGTRVVASPSVVCSSCDMCTSGLSAHCRHRAVLGVSGRDGALADQVVVPVTNLHEVPKRVDDATATLAYPLARALHCTQLVALESLRYVTVLGDDLLALLTAQGLANRNKSVRLLSENERRGAMCDKWGVKHRPMEDAGRRQDQDVVIETTGRPRLIRLALQFVRPRGTVILMPPLSMEPIPANTPVRVREDAEPIDLTIVTTNELSMIGSRDGPLPDALEMLSVGAVDTSGLIGKEWPLGEIEQAARASISGEEIATLVRIA